MRYRVQSSGGDERWQVETLRCYAMLDILILCHADEESIILRLKYLRKRMYPLYISSRLSTKMDPVSL